MEISLSPSFSSEADWAVGLRSQIEKYILVNKEGDLKNDRLSIEIKNLKDVVQRLSNKESSIFRSTMMENPTLNMVLLEKREELESGIENLKKENHELSERLKLALNQLEEKETEVKKLNQAFETLGLEKTKVEKENEEMKLHFQQEVNTLKEALKIQIEKNAALTRDQELLQNEIENLKNKNRDLENRNDELSAKTTEALINSQVANLKAENLTKVVEILLQRLAIVERRQEEQIQTNSQTQNQIQRYGDDLREAIQYQGEQIDRTKEVAEEIGDNVTGSNETSDCCDCTILLVKSIITAPFKVFT